MSGTVPAGYGVALALFPLVVLAVGGGMRLLSAGGTRKRRRRPATDGGETSRASPGVDEARAAYLDGEIDETELEAELERVIE